MTLISEIREEAAKRFISNLREEKVFEIKNFISEAIKELRKYKDLKIISIRENSDDEDSSTIDYLTIMRTCNENITVYCYIKEDNKGYKSFEIKDVADQRAVNYFGSELLHEKCNFKNDPEMKSLNKLIGLINGVNSHIKFN